MPLVQPGVCRHGDRLGAAFVVRILSIEEPFLRRHSGRCRRHSSSAYPPLPTTQRRRNPHSLYLLIQPSGSECTKTVEGKIKGGGTSLARKAVCTGVEDGTQCMHRRAVHCANARQFWLWRVPSTPHCDRLGTDIGNRTYSRKPMQRQSHAWNLVALELQDSSD